MGSIGSESNPLRVAIVGSGPSGFYATEALIKSDQKVEIDLIERLPAPFGLVRNGVAPDHPKLKQAIEVYKKIAQSPEFNFVGNVTVGEDIKAQELQETYHAVIYTCGAETDRKLGIPGEELNGSYTATEFVGWYNGHPDYRDRTFDLSHENAVVIGQGNVAADVARILAKSVDELKHTDIAQHALDVLAESKVRKIYVVGRRGPAQAKFASKELKEFLEIENCRPYIDPVELDLNTTSQREIDSKEGRGNKKNLEIFQKFAESEDTGKQRTCISTFLKSPIRLEGDRRLQKVVFEVNELSGEPFKQSAKGTGKTMEIECGILFRSIGYNGVPIPGVPFYERWGTIPNETGRITVEHGGNVLPGLYTAGWIKRGPSGIIGTNRACAVESVSAVLEDIDQFGSDKPGREGLYAVLDRNGVQYINYAQWEKVDAAEVAAGEPKGKPREKFTYCDEMLAAANS
ncbi:MAG: FAD-dependent oxidoreductase [Gammaproteobacteria bacterium]|nr:FAD-dependent oxidoreductase [Gammaproteobacteria bacterium]